MSGFFIAIYHRFTQSKFLYFGIIILLIAFISVFVPRINLKEDISAIIPDDNRINEINEFLEKFKSADQLVLNFSIKDEAQPFPDSIISFATDVMEAVKLDTHFVKEITFEVEKQFFAQTFEFFYEHLPFYMEESDYDSLKSKISKEGLENIMARNFKSIISPAGIAIAKYIFQDPLGIVSPLLKKLENFKLDDNFHVYDSYIFTKDNKNLIAFVQPKYSSKNTKENSIFIENLQSIFDAKMQNSNVHVEMYGGTAVAVANANRIKTDIMLTVSIAAVFMLFFFYLVFRSFRTFILMFLPVALGAGFSIAIISLVQGEISAIALGIGAVLLGISIDYSLHLFTHFRNGNSPEHNLRDISDPIIMSCLTTASAFLCLLIVRSEALRELGIFAAISMVASSVFVLSLLPALLSKLKGFAKKSIQHEQNSFFDKIAGISFHKNKYLVLAIFALSIVFFVFSNRIRFNSEIASLNYQSPALKSAEKNLLEISSEPLGAFYLITSGEDLDEALEYMEMQDSILKENKGLYSARSSATDLMLSEKLQKKKIERWNTFWNSANRMEAIASMQEIGAQNHFKKEAFSNFYNLIDKEFTPIRTEEFEPVSDLFLQAYLNENDEGAAVITMVKTDNEHRLGLQDLFSGHDDVTVFNQQYFTDQFFKLLNEDFKLLVTASMVIVFLILLIFFGRFELAITTFIPIALSWIWVLGIMGLFRIEFNIFNIIVSTFIFGLGIDYCIFISKGILNKHKYGDSPLKPYKLSILLSSTTTILGVGVLIFAKHPALKSIALVSIIGIISVVLIAFTILPGMLNFIIYKKGERRARPITILDAFASFGQLALFLIVSLIGTLLVPLFVVLPFNKRKKKYYFHIFIQGFYILTRVVGIRVKQNKIGFDKIDFSSPTVIISNHQSFSDLGMYLWLNPKIIALTNEWVWNSKFFGMAVRYADYYPAFKGVDHNIDNIKQKVKEGYSVLVFPEGTRSVDGSIKRFHQGAFMLADKLGIDIQPMVLHGLNHIAPKSDFFMYKGSVTLKVFDRIQVDRKKGEPSYHRQAKAVTAFYREEFAKLKQQQETTSYLHTWLVGMYLYKGPVLEWYLRVKLRLEKNYEVFNNLIPRKCKIVDIGCGYGFLANMLKLVSEERNILGIDYDKEKIAVARNTIEKRENIDFQHADVTTYNLPEADVYVINDVLHYMPLDMQRNLIEKCIKRLAPGGKIIIRDADADLVGRTRGTKFTEFMSTRFFRFNKKEYGLTYTSGTEIEKIARENSFKCNRIDHSKRTSNIIFTLSAASDA